jgi:LmbE family N-acetylglucosaminyl deacetylase
MYKKLFFILLFFILCSNPAFSASLAHLQTQGIKPIEPVRKDDRILILAPHPDDEAIGCAGIIQQALSKGARVKVVYLTNGDHNQIAFIVYEKRLTFKKGEFIHMGKVRREEAIKAMRLLGLNENDLIFLGYPDFGTLTIFSRYWQTKKPFMSLLTRISSVPYKENMSFGAPYKGESILNDLKSVLLEYKPTKIFVSHPADANQDHKALYLFLQVALSDLNKEIPNPKVYPYLIHCIGWPIPRHYHPELSLEPPEQFQDAQINWLEFSLTPGQLNKKYQAILSYKSQTESSAFYLLSFARKNELFGDYPEIELRGQPSLKERGVSFFGFSDMFRERDTGVLGGLENLTEDKGQVSYAVVDNSILIRIKKEKEIKRGLSFMLYLFGYSYKTAFASMPKICIIAKYNRFKILDGKSILKPQGVSLQLSSNALILKVPLEILGNPEFILTSMKSYGRPLPIEVIGFRKIDVK